MMPATRRAATPATEPRVTPYGERRRSLHRDVDRIVDTWPRAQVDLQAVGFPAGRGYGGTGGGRSGFTVANEAGDPEFVPATGVEIAALNSAAAVAWVAEFHDVVARVTAAAWPARAWSLTWTAAQLAPVLHAAVDRICDSWQIDDLVDLDPRSANHRRDVFGLERLADMGAAHWPPPPRKGAREGGVTVGERGNNVEVCKLCQEPVAGGRNDPIRRIDGDPYHGKSCWFTVTRQRQPKAAS